MAASLGRVLGLLLVLYCCCCGYALPEQRRPRSYHFHVNKDNRVAVIEKSVSTKTRIWSYSSCNIEPRLRHDDPSSLGKVLFYVLWFPCAKDFYNLFSKRGQLFVEDFIGKNKYGSSVYKQEMSLQVNITKRYDSYSYHYDCDIQLHNLVLGTDRKSGIHAFIFYYSFNPELVKFNADITGDLYVKGSEGYLYTTEWPLLPFYGTMVALYAVCGIVWCALMIRYMCCDTKKGVWIQGCIAIILIVGIVEYAVFLADIVHLRAHGHSLNGYRAQLSAEVMSSIKMTIALIAGILTSLGFGVIRPPCGAMLAKVLGVGALYLSLVTVKLCIQIMVIREVAVLYCSIPLIVLDVAIYCFMLSSLGKTIAEFGITKNNLELHLYKHVRNMLIFAAAASAGYYIWMFSQEQLTGCSDIDVWIKDSVWHILFFIVLLSAMVIWRPTVKYNRCEYSPIAKYDSSHDGDDDRLLDINTDDGATGTKKQNIMDYLNTQGAKEPGGEMKKETWCGGFKATTTAILKGIKDKFKNGAEVKEMKKEKLKKELEKSDLELETIQLKNKFLSLKIAKLQKQPQKPQQLLQSKAELSEHKSEAEQTGGLDVEDLLVHQYSA